MEIAILAYNGMTLLDAIGPYEVLRNIKDAEVKFVAKKRGEVRADSNMLSLQIKHSFKDVKQADILVIPGSTIAFVKVAKDKKTLAWIQEMDQTTQYTTTVCTGSIILAATGLTEGKRATSHWMPIKSLEEYGVTPVRERIVDEGKYISAAGVSAGIDMGLYLANKLVGEQETKAIQLAIEYDPAPPFQSGSFVGNEESIIELAKERLNEEAKKELNFLDYIRSGKQLYKLRKAANEAEEEE